MLPYFNYCAVVWGSNYQTHLDKLMKLQKRAIRIIMKKPFYHPTNALFVELNLLKLKDIITEQKIIILSKFVSHSLPCAISSLFQYHRPTNTRLIQHFHVPLATTNYRSFSLSCSAPKAWNQTICPTFPNLDDVPLQKYALKKFIREYFRTQYRSQEGNQ